MRLTRWNGKKWVLPQGYGAWREIADRLAAYENSGLEPEDVQALVAMYDRMFISLDQVKKSNGGE